MFSKKFWENPKKTSYLENYKILSRHIQRQDLEPPESTLKDSNNRIEIFKVLNFSTSNFLTALNYRVRNYKLCKVFYSSFLYKFWRTIKFCEVLNELFKKFEMN